MFKDHKINTTYIWITFCLVLIILCIAIYHNSDSYIRQQLHASKTTKTAEELLVLSQGISELDNIDKLKIAEIYTDNKNYFKSNEILRKLYFYVDDNCDLTKNILKLLVLNCIEIKEYKDARKYCEDFLDEESNYSDDKYSTKMLKYCKNDDTFDIKLFWIEKYFESLVFNEKQSEAIDLMENIEKYILDDYTYSDKDYILYSLYIITRSGCAECGDFENATKYMEKEVALSSKVEKRDNRHMMFETLIIYYEDYYKQVTDNNEKNRIKRRVIELLNTDKEFFLNKKVLLRHLNETIGELNFN